MGLTTGRPCYMVFGFYNSSFLGNSRTSISQGTLLKPRAGYSYDIKVSYGDDIYSVAIREVGRKFPGRDIELKGLDHCRALQKAGVC